MSRKRKNDSWVITNDPTSSYRVGRTTFDLENVEATMEQGFLYPGTVFTNYESNETLTIMWSREKGYTMKRKELT